MHRRRHKYGANKKVINGITFDSQMEAEYYMYLLQEKAKGVVVDIELQPTLQILPKFKYQSQNRRKMDYNLDFKVTYISGLVEYIDVKGMATTDAKMKRKLVEYMYPDKNIKWISKSKKYSETGWIDFDELQKIRRRNRRKK